MDAPRDVAQAAEFLGVSESWLYKQAAKRLVPHTRIARQIRFTEEHLASILAAGEQAVTRVRILQLVSDPPPRKAPPVKAPPKKASPPAGPDSPPPAKGPKKNQGSVA